MDFCDILQKKSVLRKKNNEKNNLHICGFFTLALKFIGSGKWVSINKTKINKRSND